MSAETPAGELRRDRRGYTLGEEIANGTTHGVGIGLAVAGLIVRTALAVLEDDGYKLAGAVGFGVSLVLLYLIR